MKIEILDCTIRDGGYLNKWNFSDEQVINCFKAGSESGFDYVELGFRSSKKFSMITNMVNGYFVQKKI